MNLVYIDDSKDEKCSIFSAISIPEENWQEAYQKLKEYRKEIKKSDGIYVYKELHAWEFVSGRGKISDNVVFKGRRCAIFNQTLSLIASLPGARLFNTVSPPGKDEMAFEWLLNRINIFSSKAETNAILICDQGKEKNYTRLRRRMGFYNPIPSQYQKWAETGAFHKNIPISNIIEDPFFKDSSQSYFIQLADFCAYALLRRENPLASKTRYGLDKSFALLAGILVREASRKDPEGIIRIQ